MKLLQSIWDTVLNMNCYHSIYKFSILKLSLHQDLLDTTLPSSQDGISMRQYYSVADVGTCKKRG